MGRDFKLGGLFVFNVTDRVSRKILGYGLIRMLGYFYAVIQSREENFISYN